MQNMWRRIAVCASLLLSLRTRDHGISNVRQLQEGFALRSVHPRTMYEGLAKDVLQRFKFARAQAAAADISLAMLAPELHTRVCLFVPVPTATNRVRQRGYDQTRLLARQLAASYRVSCASALARTGQERQVGMSGSIRRQQLRGAFRVTRPALVAKKHIVLVDDVVTSGATLEAAAAALKQTGAWRVDALVFARA